MDFSPLPPPPQPPKFNNYSAFRYFPYFFLVSIDISCSSPSFPPPPSVVCCLTANFWRQFRIEHWNRQLFFFSSRLAVTILFDLLEKLLLLLILFSLLQSSSSGLQWKSTIFLKIITASRFPLPPPSFLLDVPIKKKNQRIWNLKTKKKKKNVHHHHTTTHMERRR